MYRDGRVDFELKCGIRRTARAYVRAIKKKMRATRSLIWNLWCWDNGMDKEIKQPTELVYLLIYHYLVGFLYLED